MVEDELLYKTGSDFYKYKDHPEVSDNFDFFNEPNRKGEAQNSIPANG